jgi:hypothetical protein
MTVQVASNGNLLTIITLGSLESLIGLFSNITVILTANLFPPLEFGFLKLMADDVAMTIQ